MSAGEIPSALAILPRSRCVGAEPSDRAGDGLGVGDEHPAIVRGQNLAPTQAIDADVTHGADRATSEACAERLGRVLEDQGAVATGLPW